MRLERTNDDKVKVFVTFDDLHERGLDKEDLWKHSPKVEQLFREVVLEAGEKLGFQTDGLLSVEVYDLPAQGMVFLISSEQEYPWPEDDYELELEIFMDERTNYLYKLDTFEHMVQLAWRLKDLGIQGGELLSVGDRYYFHLNDHPSIHISKDIMIALLSEYGSASTKTKAYLDEYGKVIIHDAAIETITAYFAR